MTGGALHQASSQRRCTAPVLWPSRTALLMLFGAVLLCAVSADARLLHQFTYISLKGQEPNGIYSIGDRAEAGAAGAARGMRYNAGRAIVAGEAIPYARVQTNTPNAATKSLPVPGDANTNLGIEATATQGWWARASAGSGVSFTGVTSRKSAFSNDLQQFRPGNSKGAKSNAIAFTDNAANSAAVSGLGNGVMVMSWGLEVASSARSSKLIPEVREHGSRWNAAHPGRKLLQRVYRTVKPHAQRQRR